KNRLSGLCHTNSVLLWEEQAFRPVPQKFSLIVGRTGFPACATKIQFDCGTGILPVPKNNERSNF
ncbi:MULTISPECIES: hypothetical protein, partial [unclassified Microcoleus]